MNSDNFINIDTKEQFATLVTRYSFGFLLFLSVSSIVLLNKEDLIQYNIIINAVFIAFYFMWVIINKKKISIVPAFTSYTVFTFYCFLTILWSVDKSVSFELVIREISIVISIIVVYNVLRKMALFKVFYASIIFVSLINFLLLFVKIDGFDVYEAGDRFVGTMTNSNALSIVMVFNIFISVIILYNEKRIKVLALLNINLLLSLYLILMTISRKGFIAGVFLTILYLMFIPNLKNRFLVVFLLLMIVSYFSVSSDLFSGIEDVSSVLFERFEGAVDVNGKNIDESTEQRVQFISSGLEMIGEKPVFGWGVNTFLVYHEGYYAHNNYIELLVGTGFVGTFLFYLFYVFMIKSAIVSLKGSERVYIVFVLMFFVFMDIALVSYYERINFIFLSFVMAYISENRAVR